MWGGIPLDFDAKGGKKESDVDDELNSSLR
jgi:hypothetical protein